MNTRLARVSLMVLVIAVLATTPFAGAQEGEESLPYAAHGPYPVGLLRIEAETPLHPTNILIWYPALYPEGEEIVPDRPLEDAAPDTSGGPYPLVVYEVGWTADTNAAQWIGEHLASYGFVVTVKDPIDVGTGGYVNGDEKMFVRVQEVSWQIDYADSLTAAGGSLEGMIDMDRVAVAGHSLGGYTALLAGGARIDWDYFPIWCSEHYEDSYSADLDFNFCDTNVDHMRGVMARLADLDASQTGLWPSWGDSRVDAIVPLASPYWMIFGPDGIGSISVPMLFMGGSQDTIVPPVWDLFYESAGSAVKALVVLEGARHEFFYPQHLHDPRPGDLSRHFLTAFLLAVLYDDQDAAAALAPDAVQFTGITYEAQGF